MKVYKKGMMRLRIEKGEILYISHPLYSKFFNRSIDAIKINKRSLMHSLKGLHRVLQGSLTYVPEESRLKFVDIEEVIMGNRIITYAKYLECIECNIKISNIIRCLH